MLPQEIPHEFGIREAVKAPPLRLHPGIKAPIEVNGNTFDDPLAFQPGAPVSRFWHGGDMQQSTQSDKSRTEVLTHGSSWRTGGPTRPNLCRDAGVRWGIRTRVSQEISPLSCDVAVWRT